LVSEEIDLVSEEIVLISEEIDYRPTDQIDENTVSMLIDDDNFGIISQVE
jgi:hypothetical protein